MREIKFRAWDKDNNEIILSNSLSFHEYVTVADHFSDDDKIFMQFTGAKDFFESEIYEGDIVFLDSRMMNGEIINDGISWRIKFKDELDWLCDWHDDLHVIGNIYQNKDLLND